MEMMEAARMLRHVHQNAPQGKKVVYVHLFGIRYADELRDLPCARLIDLADVPTSYYMELWRARNLAEYVEIKEDIEF